MARGKNTIVQRIRLDGGKEIRDELLALGKAGEKAFNLLHQATADTELTGFNKQVFRLQGGLTQLGDAARKVGGHFAFLGGEIGRAAGVFLGAFSVNALIDMTAAWTDLNSRVENAVGDHVAAGDAIARLGEIARRTYSPLEATVDGFTRLSPVLKELGFNTEKVLDFQEALNNALVISGARGQRLEQVQTAVNKAMAVGKLDAEGLQAIMANGPRIVDALTKALGTNRQGLAALVSQGKVTSQVIGKALLADFQNLRTEAEAMPATIKDAFVLIQNALLQFIGTADQASGVSNAIAQALIWVADNIDIVVIALASLVGAFIAVKAVNLAVDIFNLGKAFVALLPKITAVTLALLKNPFVFLAAVIIAVTTAVFQATGGWEKWGKVLGDFFTELKPLIDGFSNAIMGVIKWLGEAAHAILAFFGITGKEAPGAAEAVAKIDESVASVNAGLAATPGQVKSATDSISKGFEKSADSIENVWTQLDTMIWKLKGGVEQAQKLSAALDAVGGSSGSFQTLHSGGDTPSIQTLARGGQVRGAGTGTSDSILARLSNGEFVMKAKAVRKWGTGLLSRLNAGLPAFAGGGMANFAKFSAAGQAGGAMASGGGAWSTGVGGGTPITLDFGGGEVFGPMMAPDDVANSLTQFAFGRNIRQTGTKPTWYASGKRG